MSDESGNILEFPERGPVPDSSSDVDENPVVAALEVALEYARANPDKVSASALVLLTEDEGASGVFTYWGWHAHVSPFAVLGAAQSLAHDMAVACSE